MGKPNKKMLKANKRTSLKRRKQLERRQGLRPAAAPIPQQNTQASGGS